MQDKYDPMTGELLSGKKAEDNAERRFDPMTGELLSGKKAEDNAGWQFDPMTGKALSGKKAKDDSKWQFDPMTGKPVKKKKGKAIKTAAVVIVLAVVVFAAFKSGLFLSKGSKVLNAAKNTVDIDSHLVDALKKVSILRSDSYTVEYQMEDNEDDIYVDVIYAGSPQKDWMEGSIGLGNHDFVFMAEFTPSQLRVKFPDLDDRIFIYNYQGNKEGKSGFTINAGGDVLDTDDILSLGREILDVVRTEYHSLEFETVDKKEFKINGTKRNCKGYRTTITSDNVKEVLRNIKDVCKDEYGLDALLDVIGYADLINESRDMPDKEVTFYLYKNRLVCINLESEGRYVRVLFDGDGKVEQSVRVIADGEDVLELKKTEKNTQERYSMTAGDEEVLEVRYDYQSGDYILEVYDSYNILKVCDSDSYSYYIMEDIIDYIIDDMTVEGSLVADSGGLGASVDVVDIRQETLDLGITLSIRKGSTPGELDGEEFDIGDASKKELEDLGNYLFTVRNMFYRRIYLVDPAPVAPASAPAAPAAEAAHD